MVACKIIELQSCREDHMRVRGLMCCRDTGGQSGVAALVSNCVSGQRQGTLYQLVRDEGFCFGGLCLQHSDVPVALEWGQEGRPVGSAEP